MPEIALCEKNDEIEYANKQLVEKILKLEEGSNKEAIGNNSIDAKVKKLKN